MLVSPRLAQEAEKISQQYNEKNTILNFAQDIIIDVIEDK